MSYIIAIIILIVGLICGIGITVVCMSDAANGDLIVMYDDKTGEPYLFLELSENAQKLRDKKFVTFEIKRK